MPLYTFALKDDRRVVEDDSGIRLPDREQALRYADEVVRELMSGCETQTRTWRLDVYEAGAGLIGEIPFARRYDA